MLERVKRPIFGPTKSKGKGAGRKSVTRVGHEDGPLFGETVVFTGSLAVQRDQVADLAASAGFDVRPGVTKKTTMLVEGLQDKRKLGDHEESSKQRNAEQLSRQGSDIQIIQILSEDDFSEFAKIAMPVVSAVDNKTEPAPARRGRVLEVAVELPPELERTLRQLREEFADSSGE